MKKALRILAAVVLLSVVVLGALQWALNRRLTGYVQRWVLPRAESSLGSRVELDQAVANLFGAAVEARGIRVQGPDNKSGPPMLSIGSGRLGVALTSLLFGAPRVSKLKADHVVLRIVSDKRANTNLASHGESTQPKPTRPESDAAKQAARRSGQRPEPPRIRMDNVQLDLLLRLVQHEDDGTTVELPLELAFQGWDLGTYDFGKPGRLAVKGHLAGSPAACVVDLQGTAGPLGRGVPDFSIAGTVKNVDRKFLESLIRKSGVEGDNASVIVKLACVKGTYQAGSTLVLSVANARLRQGKKDPTYIALPPGFALTIPVTGSVEDPKLDLTSGLITGFLSGFAAPGGTAATNPQADDLERTLKDLGAAFKKKKKKP